MSATTAREAIRLDLARLQSALRSVTIANQVVPHDAGEDRIVTIAPPRREGVRLRHTRQLELQFGYTVQLVEVGRGRWEAQLRRYHFTLVLEGVELLAFHWHPEVLGRPHPHIHLGPASQAVGLLRESHIPASNISLEEVLAYAIRELHVEPVREDWAAILVGRAG